MPNPSSIVVLHERPRNGRARTISRRTATEGRVRVHPRHEPVHDLRAARGVLLAIACGAGCWTLMASLAYWLFH